MAVTTAASVDPPVTVFLLVQDQRSQVAEANAERDKKFALFVFMKMSQVQGLEGAPVLRLSFRELQFDICEHSNEMG